MAVASYHPRILIPKYGQTAYAKPLTTNDLSGNVAINLTIDHIVRQTNYLGKKTFRQDSFRIANNTLCLLPKYLR